MLCTNKLKREAQQSNKDFSLLTHRVGLFLNERVTSILKIFSTLQNADEVELFFFSSNLLEKLIFEQNFCRNLVLNDFIFVLILSDNI